MKIGNRKIIFSNVFLMPENEAIEFEHLLAESDLLKCRVKFSTEDNAEDKNAKIKTEMSEDTFVINFINFSSPLGHTTNALHIFALSNNREEISFFAAGYKFANIYKLEFQLMLEVK